MQVINPVMSILARPDTGTLSLKTLSKVPHIRYWKTDELPERSLWY
jgi:hypothetical protein